MGGLTAAWGDGNGPVSCLSRERWNKSGRAGRERRGGIVDGESMSPFMHHISNLIWPNLYSTSKRKS